MDFDHGMNIAEKKKVSVLKQDELFFNRIISRNSSVGCSSRIFYCRSSQGVPFNWEMQPGTPKDPPKEEILPPLSPPPAIISLGLPKPCIDTQEPKPPFLSRVKFWKHMKKIKRSMKSQEMLQVSNVNGPGSRLSSRSDKFERCEFCSSDAEFMSSPRNSFSSCSSSLSFSNSQSRQSSKFEAPARGSMKETFNYGCSPWNLNSILVYVAKRV